MKSFVVSAVVLTLLIVGVVFLGCVSEKESTALLDMSDALSDNRDDFASDQNQEQLKKLAAYWNQKKKFFCWFISGKDLEEVDRIFTCLSTAQETENFSGYLEQVRLLRSTLEEFRRINGNSLLDTI